MRLRDLLQSKQESASCLLATGNLECPLGAAQLGMHLKLPVRAGWKLGWAFSRVSGWGLLRSECHLGGSEISQSTHGLKVITSP